MKKIRQHNEWFRPVSLNNRKSCPCCKTKLTQGELIWSWGEYRYAKWRTVKHFCRQCFIKEVQTPLLSHGSDCGCQINLIVMSLDTPDWLSLQCKLESANSTTQEVSSMESGTLV